MVRLSANQAVRPEAMRYLNCLADLVWMLARYAERTEARPRPR